MWDLIVSVPDHCLSFYFKPHGIQLIFSDNKEGSVVFKLHTFFKAVDSFI